MIEINSLPVVIISSPRSGSTALATTLKNKLDCMLFVEPGLDDLKLNQFLRYASMKNDYILKEHAEVFLKKYPNFDLRNCTVIRIKRKNFISQVVSSYITGKRKKWFYTEEDHHYGNTLVPLDESFLQEVFSYIKKQNRIVDNFKGKVDIEVNYEDIEHELTNCQRTIQPKNYVELLEWAKKVYEQT
jgi:hypothetical protein